jgi:hypothetical protein
MDQANPHKFIKMIGGYDPRDMMFFLLNGIHQRLLGKSRRKEKKRQD